MPMFVKMGLGGTGNMGHKESFLRSARKRAARRKVSDGYPMPPLKDSQELLAYFSGDKITCMVCGRSLRTLAVHIKRIHGMSANAYKDRFGIPQGWTLSCRETTEIHSKISKKAVEDGVIAVSSDQAELARMAISNRTGPRQRSKDGLRKVVVNSLKKTNPAKIGTKEHHKKMKARPQCDPSVVGARLGGYWRGRKQSPEHIRKRIRRTEST